MRIIELPVHEESPESTAKIRNISLDGKGNIWAATFNSGLGLLRSQQNVSSLINADGLVIDGGLPTQLWYQIFMTKVAQLWPRVLMDTYTR